MVTRPPCNLQASRSLWVLVIIFFFRFSFFNYKFLVQFYCFNEFLVHWHSFILSFSSGVFWLKKSFTSLQLLEVLMVSSIPIKATALVEILENLPVPRKSLKNCKTTHTLKSTDASRTNLLPFASTHASKNWAMYFLNSLNFFAISAALPSLFATTP